VWRVGQAPADLAKLQTLPCYFYNSKFWVEGDRVFTNSEGIDGLRLGGDRPRRPVGSSLRDASRCQLDSRTGIRWEVNETNGPCGCAEAALPYRHDGMVLCQGTKFHPQLR
jgi:hypothetical protein